MTHETEPILEGAADRTSGREGSTDAATTATRGTGPDAPKLSRNTRLSTEAGAGQPAPVTTEPHDGVREAKPRKTMPRRDGDPGCMVAYLKLGVREAKPRKTMPRREGDPGWLVAYLKLGKNGKATPEYAERIFTDANDAIAFFAKQREGCASLWRAEGMNYVQQEVFPSEKGGAAKTV